MSERNFIHQFEQVAVPKVLRHIGEGDASAVEIRARFFAQVAESLMSYLATQACTEEVTVELRPSNPPEYSHELWLKDVAPLAFAHDGPDDHHTRQVSFGKFPLTPQAVDVIAEIERADDIIWRA